VLGVALQRCVQNADVQPAGNRLRVAGKQVLGGGRHPEAAAVQRHPQGLEPEGLGLARGKDMHVVGQFEPARHLALGIVVAVQQIDGDARLPQPPHLPDEEQPRVEVLPVAVVDIARDHHEIDLLVDGMGDERLKSVAGGGAQTLGWRVRVGGKPPQGAVEMEVGGVDELHDGPGVRAGAARIRARRLSGHAARRFCRCPPHPLCRRARSAREGAATQQRAPRSSALQAPPAPA
jgi:hypothetical protein